MHLQLKDNTITTMTAELEHNHLAYFLNKPVALALHSDQSPQATQTNGVPLTTHQLQDRIQAQTMLQILYATAVEDLATMLIDA